MRLRYGYMLAGVAWTLFFCTGRSLLRALRRCWCALALYFLAIILGPQPPSGVLLTTGLVVLLSTAAGCIYVALQVMGRKREIEAREDWRPGTGEESSFWGPRRSIMALISITGAAFLAALDPSARDTCSEWSNAKLFVCRTWVDHAPDPSPLLARATTVGDFQANTCILWERSDPTGCVGRSTA